MHITCPSGMARMSSEFATQDPRKCSSGPTLHMQDGGGAPCIFDTCACHRPSGSHADACKIMMSPHDSMHIVSYLQPLSTAALVLHVHKDELSSGKPQEQAVICKPRSSAACQIHLQSLCSWCPCCCCWSSFLRAQEAQSKLYDSCRRGDLSL